MSIIWWTDEEREILKIFYPRADRKIILDMLKNKSWYACRKEAERTGIKRIVSHQGRSKKKKTERLVKQSWKSY